MRLLVLCYMRISFLKEFQIIEKKVSVPPFVYAPDMFLSTSPPLHSKISSSG